MNLDIFKRKAPPLFGMDISSSSVKMVELADAGRGSPRVERYAIEALPKDAVLDGNITNLDAVVDAVQRAWKRMATRTKNVALALPTAAVITKKIFFSTRMRHARFDCDWSSDVCSSDLLGAQLRGHWLARGVRRIASRAREHEGAGMLDRATDEKPEIPPVIDEMANELHASGGVRR